MKNIFKRDAAWNWGIVTTEPEPVVGDLYRIVTDNSGIFADGGILRSYKITDDRVYGLYLTNPGSNGTYRKETPTSVSMPDGYWIYSRLDCVEWL